MTQGKGKLPALSAALAGIPAGVQATGPWSGRRQLFVKFAEEAETATIYTSGALIGELTRLMARSKYHSVAIVGRDVLNEVEFLVAAFAEKGALPVMLDHDGQRPDALNGIVHALSLVQVTVDGSESGATLDRICATIALSAKKQVPQALVIIPPDAVSDGALLRIVEQVHEASGTVEVVLHPTAETAPDRDRRWSVWLQQAMSVHGDVRVMPRWPMPAGR